MAEFSVLGTDASLTAQKAASDDSYPLTPEDRAWLGGVYEKLKVKMKAEVERIGTMIPYTTREGKYHDLDVPGGLYFWTNGFWPGMLWQMYNATGDEVYRSTAEGVEDRMKEVLTSTMISGSCSSRCRWPTGVRPAVRKPAAMRCMPLICWLAVSTRSASTSAHGTTHLGPAMKSVVG